MQTAVICTISASRFVDADIFDLCAKGGRWDGKLYRSGKEENEKKNEGENKGIQAYLSSADPPGSLYPGFPLLSHFGPVPSFF